MESTWSAVWLAAAEYETGEHAAARELIRAAIPNPNQVSHAAVLAARQAREWLEGLRKDPELRSHLRGLFDKADRLDEQLPPIRRQLRRLAHTMEMPTPSLIIQAFGAGQVWVNGQSVTMSDWQTQSVRELFFYFLAANRAAHAAIRSAWRSGRTLKTRTNSGCASRTRSIACDAPLARTRSCSTAKCMVSTPPSITNMTWRPLRPMSQGEGRREAAEKIDFYERAINLVQGKYLEDMGSLVDPT